jgi:hypothetical protein
MYGILKPYVILGLVWPWKIASGAESLVLQALQFKQMGICCKFPDGRSISHCVSNEFFVED